MKTLMTIYLGVSAILAYVAVGILFAWAMNKLTGTPASEDDTGMIMFWPLALVMMIIVMPYELVCFLWRKLNGLEDTEDE